MFGIGESDDPQKQAQKQKKRARDNLYLIRDKTSAEAQNLIDILIESMERMPDGAVEAEPSGEPRSYRWYVVYASPAAQQSPAHIRLTQELPEAYFKVNDQDVFRGVPVTVQIQVVAPEGQFGSVEMPTLSLSLNMYQPEAPDATLRQLPGVTLSVSHEGSFDPQGVRAPNTDQAAPAPEGGTKSYNIGDVLQTLKSSVESLPK